MSGSGGGVIQLPARRRRQLPVEPAMPVTPPDSDEPTLSFWQRMAWFAGLALSGALAFAGVGYLLKALLQ